MALPPVSWRKSSALNRSSGKRQLLALWSSFSRSRFRSQLSPPCGSIWADSGHLIIRVCFVNSSSCSPPRTWRVPLDPRCSVGRGIMERPVSAPSPLSLAQCTWLLDLRSGIFNFIFIRLWPVALGRRAPLPSIRLAPLIGPWFQLTGCQLRPREISLHCQHGSLGGSVLPVSCAAARAVGQ